MLDSFFFFNNPNAIIEMGGSILLRILFVCSIGTLLSEAYRVVESEDETSTPFEPYEKGFVGKVSTV